MTGTETKPGLGITHPTRKSAREAIRQHFASFIPLHVVTLAPEMCVRACDDSEFSRIIDNAGMVVADGVGVAWGEGKLTGVKPEKVPGIELATWTLEEVDRIAGRVYLLGSKPEVVEKAAERLSGDYPRLTIAGFRDGYFNEDDEAGIVEEIADRNPHLLLVGTGSPKQEFFIAKHLTDLKCAVAIGIGGSFDVWSGMVNRAPGFFQKTGTEWLYRTLSQPGDRLKRIPVLWRYMMLIIMAGRTGVLWER